MEKVQRLSGYWVLQFYIVLSQDIVYSHKKLCHIVVLYILHFSLLREGIYCEYMGFYN